MGNRLNADQLVALCADTWEAAPPISWWRHKKTGGVYEVQGAALTSNMLSPVVLYMNVEGGGPLFTRPAEEFLDGRFERIDTKKEET